MPASGLWELPTESEWWTVTALVAGVSGIVGLGEYARRRLSWRPEATRKLVHMSVGVLIAFTPWMLTVPLPAIVLAVFFIVLNWTASRKGWLKGIHDASKDSYGTTLFPLSFLVLVVLFWYESRLILCLSLLVVALGDASAALVGTGLKSTRDYRLTGDRKSVEGSVAMFVVTFALLSGGLLVAVPPDRISVGALFLCAGVAAVSATAAEAISSRGLDNFTVPLSVAIVLSFFLIPGGQDGVLRMAIAPALGALIACVSVLTKVLTLSGGIAAFLLSIVIFGVGGWEWAVPLLAFFLLSSALTKLRSSKMGREVRSDEDAVGRDHAQVFANGGVGGMIVLLAYWFPTWNLYPAYVGSLAAVTADTWGTEVGVLGGGKTVQIPSFRIVSPGTDGGVSLPGLVSGILGSAVIALSGVAWMDVRNAIPVIMAGTSGSLLDSVLGGTLQAQYRCDVCGRVTGRRFHCGTKTGTHAGGIQFLSNNGVNWLCAGTGAVTVVLMNGWVS